MIYPHATCLSASVLREIFERAGFHPGDHGYSFGGQYLWMEASTDSARASFAGANGTVSTDVIQFTDRLAAKRERWSDRLELLLAEHSVVVWGAGAKGTTFLNLIAGGKSVGNVVDVNPRKHGKYVAGTGQRINAPSSVQEQQPGTVVVMNPVYSDEIRRALRELGCEADVLVA